MATRTSLTGGGDQWMGEPKLKGRRLTKLLEHFVALVQSKVFDILGIQNLVSSEGIQATRSSHNNVWAPVLVTKDFRVLLYGSTAIEGVDPYVRHVLGKPRVLVLDLEGEFTGVTQDNDGNFAIHRLQLLQRCKYEDRGLAVPRLCLTKDVHSQDGLRDTFLLNCEWW